MRPLLAGMVLLVAFAAVTVIFYMMLLRTAVPIASRLKSLLRKPRVQQSNEYPVIVGSSVESQFLTLEVHSCPVYYTPTSIQWNNIYWQKVSDKIIYLYSAFYDARYVYLQTRYHYVRIIGMSVGAIPEEEELFCSLWYQELKEPVVVRTEVSEIWLQQWDQHPYPDTYRIYLFTCPVPLTVRDTGFYPTFVSLSPQACGDVTTKLPVNKKGLDEWQKERTKKQYAVCVKGLDFKEDISIKLIEWLELLSILGADKVFIYKYSVHQNTDKVLDYYARKGRVVVTPLTLPGNQPNDPEVRSLYLKRALWQKRRNELVPYNDCLYRNIYFYNYIIPLDVDEVIVPVKSRVWSDMFTELQKQYPRAIEKYASFSAQNVYFLDVYNATQNPGMPDYLYMLQHNVRSANFSDFGYSVKSFVSTNTSLSVFNHYTLESLYPKLKRNLVLNRTLVQMNHYKERCPREIYRQCKSNFLVYTKKDNILDKYSEKLVQRVESVVHELSLLG